MKIQEKSVRRIKNVGYAALEVADLQKSLDFYVRCCNLVPTYEDKEVVFLRSQFEHHCVALYASSETKLRHIGFETLSDADTEALHVFVKNLGIPTREAPPVPGRMGFAFQFQDIEGTWVEVYRAMSKMPSPVSQRAFRINKLGHYTMLAKDVNSITKFYQQLGFRLSDAGERGTWLRCNNDHHGLAFLKANTSTLHHHGYDIGSWDQMKLVLDWLYTQGVAPEAGPVRHNQGNNIALYVRDPDGFIVEYYCELEQIWDDEDHVRQFSVNKFDIWSRKSAPEGFNEFQFVDRGI